MVDCAAGQGLHLTRFEGPTQCLWATFSFFCLQMRKRGRELTNAPVPVGLLDKGHIKKGLVQQPALPLVPAHGWGQETLLQKPRFSPPGGRGSSVAITNIVNTT